MKKNRKPRKTVISVAELRHRAALNRRVYKLACERAAKRLAALR